MMDYGHGHRSSSQVMSGGGSSRSGTTSRSGMPTSAGSAAQLSRTSSTGGGGMGSRMPTASAGMIGGAGSGSSRAGGMDVSGRAPSSGDILNGPGGMFGSYEPAGGPRFDMSEFPALGGEGGHHGHHMGMGGLSHHGLHHSGGGGGDPRDFGADEFPALSSPSHHAAAAAAALQQQRIAAASGGVVGVGGVSGDRSSNIVGGGNTSASSSGGLDLSSLHAMAQSSGYMGGDENGYEYHGEHSRTFPGHGAAGSSVSRGGRAPTSGMSRSSAPGALGGGLGGGGLGGGVNGLSGAVVQLPTPTGSSVSSVQAQVAAAQAAARGDASSRSSRGTASARPTRSTASSPAGERFGLRGLLGVIRMTDPDLNTLALGTDLTTLGLNLNSTEVLYATFAYPSADVPTRREPDYVLPYCYYMQPPALKTSHLSKFKLETLFYIFYNMPKDLLQVYAAKELYNREWRYHKELKLWFTRPSTEVVKNLPGGAAAAAGSFVYFDINSWERRLFRDNNMIPGGAKFMTEEEHSILS